MPLSRWTRVAAVKDLKEGEMMAVKAEGQEIVLGHQNSQYFAMDLWCTHTFTLLDQGTLDGWELECPLHEGRFDIRTGEAVQLPAEEPLNVYSVKVEGEDILVGPR